METEPIPVASRTKAWVWGARFLGLWVRIFQGTWMSIPCECCVLSVKGLCDGSITRPEEVLPTVVCLSVLSKSQK